MSTPSFGQISFGDLKSELSLIGGPSANISLANMASYVMADGFWDTYGFTGQTGFGGGPVNLSFFYLLETFASFDFNVGSSITDYDLFNSALSNLSQAGGTFGANASPNSFNNPASGTLSPGTNNAENITHMQDLIVGVNCTNNSPRPPFTDLYVEFDKNSVGSWTSFPGSPFNGPIINVNSGTQSNAGNATPGTPVFAVRCYQ